MTDISTDQVWAEIDRHIFAVVGMVSARQQARTAGIVYLVRDRRLYFGTSVHEWKVRHLRGNPHASVTVPIAKRIPLMPFIKIPAATITFAATARVLLDDEVPDGVLAELDAGLRDDPSASSSAAVVELTPTGDFVTYGVGVSLNTMRDTVRARGRAPVGVA
ncbi:MAG: pyridoxamine 5'-phosphate oxidase family protein [Actinomycetota bacterium]